ncbi:MAG TPA: hypothetical protein VGV37_02495 [Aliidongia sp.]|uniref:hypothetical protein n=1 Tax=Aliidongia sp. TaxID=1914230 RepID=UPI002DDD4300|nr:hypothetical protein [Aliidongia sp.]HEV2673380.1 hypothetical protein [Aliidongia sp.]
MRVDLDLTDFTAGELSPRMKGRTDEAKYYDGSAIQRNMVTLPQGGATRRPGTALSDLAASQAAKARLKGFVFSTVQAYMLEFSIVAGVCQVRIFKNGFPVLNGSAQVVVTGLPYSQAELAEIQFTQSTDTLYIFHRNHPQASLTRSSHVAWSYQVLVFRDGPYLDLNGTVTTLTPSGTSGTITLTASSIVGINKTPQSTGQGFLATDVGRMVRIKLTSCWAWCLITVVTSATVVSAVVQPRVIGGAWSALDGAPWAASTLYATGVIVTNGANTYECVIAGTSAASGGPSGTTAQIADCTATWEYVPSIPTATTFWRLGRWTSVDGYPAWGRFWQQRLLMAGSISTPNAIVGSVISDFTAMSPTQQDGTVVDTNALSWVISDDEVNDVRWLAAAGSAQAMQLGIGTSGSEHIMQAATTAQALTPTSVQVYQETAYGAAPNVPALRIGKSVLFPDEPGRKVREWTFSWQVNGYSGPDLVVLSEHITRSIPAGLQGIVAWCYQQSPLSVIWANRGDGALISCTYQRDQNIVAWASHALGGQYYGAAPLVESLDTIPSPDGTYDQLWLQVLRTINGVPTRTIEVMQPYFDALPLDQSWFVDCALTSALTYPAATLTYSAASGTGVNFTASASVLGGVADNSLIRVNGGLAVVRRVTDGNFLVGDWYIPPGSMAPAPAGSWSVDPQHATFAGLGYLAGEVVQIIGDGADLGTQTVPAGGVVTPIETATYATIGLPAEAILLTMPLEPIRAAQATTQGRARTIDTMWLRLHESLGCNFGRRIIDDQTGLVEDAVEPLETRSAGMPMGQPPSLFSGIQRLKMSGGYDQECQILITTSGPYPLTVLAISAKADVGEMPNE